VQRLPFVPPNKAKEALLGLFFGGSRSTRFDMKGRHEHSLVVFALIGVFLSCIHRLYQERADITVGNLNRQVFQSNAGEIYRNVVTLNTVPDTYMRRRSLWPMHDCAIPDFLQRQKERFPMLARMVQTPP
jgi:hypothetical protein